MQELVRNLRSLGVNAADLNLPTGISTQIIIKEKK